MKVAITGKGGVGKTTIAAMLARSLARSVDVVAVDADPNPNLAIALGMGVEAAGRIAAITNVLLEQKLAATAESSGHDHDEPHDHDVPHQHPEPPMAAESLLDEWGVLAPDGVRLVQTGRIERPSGGCLCCGSHRTSRQFFEELGDEGRVVVADLEAGVNDLMWLWPKPEDTVLIVTETYWKSIEVSRRALQVARELEVSRIFLVVNRAETAADVDQVRRALPGLPTLVVPDEPAIMAAARAGRSVMDTAPSCPAVETVASFVPVLLDQTWLPPRAEQPVVPASVAPAAAPSSLRLVRPEPPTGTRSY